MAELLTFGSVKGLIEELPKAQGALVNDITPGQITVSGIQRVLQNSAPRAHLDPRLRHHPRSHRRGQPPPRPIFSPSPSMSARASPASSATRTSTPPAPCPSSRSRPTGSRPSRSRSSARARKRSLATKPSKLSERPRHPRALRGCGARGRGSGAGHSSGVRPFEALHCRALPHPDQRAVAERDSSARAAEDGGRDLGQHARLPPRSIHIGRFLAHSVYFFAFACVSAKYFSYSSPIMILMAMP